MLGQPGGGEQTRRMSAARAIMLAVFVGHGKPLARLLPWTSRQLCKELAIRAFPKEALHD
ncbi:hypothetical protein TPL01_22960 [Sulfuriferula plumbiphila]|uniref:Uncharacterized protein n=1 Tax=Sulfuriferula plumbiphila TaxID=171865 RepID=A0A512L9J6_9PROT|nr:hypothetical protein SFPGR_34270 [Sulfuriferula plumbiphila]GEP31158.1 hypothetical protein TPL01_22960 [Sulfuriferula plumbiphila]